MKEQYEEMEKVVYFKNMLKKKKTLESIFTVKMNTLTFSSISNSSMTYGYMDTYTTTKYMFLVIYTYLSKIKIDLNDDISIRK